MNDIINSGALNFAATAISLFGAIVALVAGSLSIVQACAQTSRSNCWKRCLNRKSVRPHCCVACVRRTSRRRRRLPHLLTQHRMTMTVSSALWLNVNHQRPGGDGHGLKNPGTTLQKRITARTGFATRVKSGISPAICAAGRTNVKPRGCRIRLLAGTTRLSASGGSLQLLTATKTVSGGSAMPRCCCVLTVAICSPIRFSPAGLRQ